MNKKNTGITLIALVITIIVLLILAGVTISTLTGQNGILTNATKAKEENEIGKEKEIVKTAATAAYTKTLGQEIREEDLKTELDQNPGDGKYTLTQKEDTFIIKFTDSNRSYLVDQLGKVEPYENPNDILDKLNEKKDEYLEEAKQKGQSDSNGNIGVDENLEVVNMDYWKTYDDDENDGIGLCEYSGSTGSAGYIGPIDENGKISGNIPKYVLKVGIDAGFLPVTRLDCTFRELDITEVPNIPDTVISMSATFYNCNSLFKAPIIPDSVIQMDYTFANCTYLEEVPNIPNKITYLDNTFLSCQSLSVSPKIPDTVINLYETFKHSGLFIAPEIPNSVTSMYGTFEGCTNLTTAPKIPESVTSLYFTFKECLNLTGTLIVNAQITHPENCEGFLVEATTGEGTNLIVTGTCPYLDELIATKSPNSNISKGN